jgi:predicted nucleic acid-binding protein
LSDAAIICDTGALLDYLVASAPDHRRFRVAIDGARARYIPGLVLAEVDYFLRDERPSMRALIADMQRGAFLYAPPTEAQLWRAMEIDAAYSTLDLGIVDASIVALAEELGVTRLATSDVRDFAAVRLADGRAFELMVEPARPDRPRRRRRRGRRFEV